MEISLLSLRALRLSRVHRGHENCNPRRFSRSTCPGRGLCNRGDGRPRGDQFTITACTHEGWNGSRPRMPRGVAMADGQGEAAHSEEATPLDNPAVKARRVDLDDCAELLKRHKLRSPRALASE